MSERLEKIFKENAEFEEKTPYNFCDRWCERCIDEKQKRCRLYQDELEQKITAIAHGRDTDDLEVMEQVTQWQFEGVDEKMQKFMEENDIDLDEYGAEYERIEKEIEERVKNDPLDATAEQYQERAHKFLKDTFYDKKVVKPELVYDFETVSWYHTLFPVKLKRALHGFHEPPDEYDFGMCDAVAQLQICKKSINESVKALRKIKPYYTSHKNSIIELLALSHNIFSRIEAMETSI